MDKKRIQLTLSKNKQDLKDQMLEHFPKSWHIQIKEAFMYNDASMIQDLQFQMTKQHNISFSS